MFLGFGIYIGLLCLLISNSLDTQVILISILTEVQHSEKAVFSFEKGSNCQNHSYGYLKNCKIDELNADNLTKIYLDKIDMNIHAPLKKLINTS